MVYGYGTTAIWARSHITEAGQICLFPTEYYIKSGCSDSLVTNNDVPGSPCSINVSFRGQADCVTANEDGWTTGDEDRKKREKRKNE